MTIKNMTVETSRTAYTAAVENVTQTLMNTAGASLIAACALYFQGSGDPSADTPAAPQTQYSQAVAVDFSQASVSVPRRLPPIYAIDDGVAPLPAAAQQEPRHAQRRTQVADRRAWIENPHYTR